jgi:hypothetical protein
MTCASLFNLFLILIELSSKCTSTACTSHLHLVILIYCPFSGFMYPSWHICIPLMCCPYLPPVSSIPVYSLYAIGLLLLAMALRAPVPVVYMPWVNSIVLPQFDISEFPPTTFVRQSSSLRHHNLHIQPWSSSLSNFDACFSLHPISAGLHQTLHFGYTSKGLTYLTVQVSGEVFIVS